MAAKPEDMIEHCDECGVKLEVGQIGLCDSCQADAQKGITSEQAASAAAIAFEVAKTRWDQAVAEGKPCECLIESTDIFEGLSRLSLPSSDVAEGLVEDALSDLGYYTKAAEAYKATQVAS